MSKKKQTKHDRIVDMLMEDLQKTEMYDSLEHHLCYSLGEVDLFGVMTENFERTLYLFEIKTTDRERGRSKALEQLCRAERFFGSDYDEVKRFYVTGIKKCNDGYKLVEV